MEELVKPEPAMGTKDKRSHRNKKPVSYAGQGRYELGNCHCID